MLEQDPSRVLAETLVRTEAMAQSAEMLLQQLLWLLLAKGLLEKSEIVAAIDTCILTTKRSSTAASDVAASYFLQIKATVETGDPSQRAN